MRKTQALTFLASVASTLAADAPVTNSNEKGVSFVAEFKDGIMGSVKATSADNGEGVQFAVDFSNLPSGAGPFGYHIHVNRVLADKPKDCDSTGGHLNPFKSTQCAADKQATCEVGDLSGKHGKADGPTFKKEYLDLYASTNSENEAFIGDKSIVIHHKDGSRLACANFEAVMGTKPPATTKPPTATKPPSTGYPNPTYPTTTDLPPTNLPAAASHIGMSFAGLFVAAGALAWML